MDEIKRKLSELASKLNKQGVPIPLLRDPKTGEGSISFSMMFISFNIVAVGLIGKYAKILEGIDLNQAQNLFLATSALYFGRTLTLKTDKNGMNAQSTEQKEGQDK